jgi:hypothetical protein
MFDIVSGALRVSLVTFVLCGFVYPFAVTVLGQLLTPFQAHGSLATSADGVVLGSRLIGQNWTDPKWFHAMAPCICLDKKIQTPMMAIKGSPGGCRSNLRSSGEPGGPTSKTPRDTPAKLLEPLRIAQEFDDFLEVFLGLREGGLAGLCWLARGSRAMNSPHYRVRESSS